MPYDLTDSEDRFRFEVERHVLNREVKGIRIYPDHVVMALDDGRGIIFRVNGADIEITIVPPPEESPAWDERRIQ